MSLRLDKRPDVQPSTGVASPVLVRPTKAQLANIVEAAFKKQYPPQGGKAYEFLPQSFAVGPTFGSSISFSFEAKVHSLGRGGVGNPFPRHFSGSYDMATRAVKIGLPVEACPGCGMG